MSDFLSLLRENVLLFDVIFLIFIGYFSIQCFAKGFFISLVSFLKWILALVITIILVPKLEPYISDYISNDYLKGIGLGVAVYILSLFILILLGRSLGRLFSYTGMGTVAMGNNRDSAVDKNDGNPACFSLGDCGAAELLGASWSGAGGADGDKLSGNSVAYSNSMGGIGFMITRGMESDTVNPVMSYAVSGSMMGATVKAGVSSIDYKDTSTADVDPSFVTVSYSVAGLNLGYGMYDNDSGSEETTMGVGTSMGGFDMGIQFASLDATTDVDMMEVSINKSMGAASFGLDYTDTDEAGGTANDTQNWRFGYVVGF